MYHPQIVSRVALRKDEIIRRTSLKTNSLQKLKAKAQVLGIAPLNRTQQCQRRFTTVEVVSDWHWL